MWDFIYNTFNFFTDIPYNIWLWFLLGIPPVLVWAANPKDRVRWRIARLIIAIVIGYVLINLSYNTSYKQGWNAYDICQSQFHDGSIQRHKECGNPPRGISLFFIAIVGWIPVAAYVGFWEWRWLKKHHVDIEAMGKAFRGKWFSKLLIVCSVPVWIYAFLIFLLFIYYRIDCPKSIIALGKCWIPH